ncbi:MULTISPECIES: DUF3854 domain-containing protein [unclassified Microcoleus]|uniref:DUF3854 domain-containing protein n=1 Tax=unclassified Microcoleus TaxID=2642155 RepID=UPI002FD4CBDC
MYSIPRPDLSSSIFSKLAQNCHNSSRLNDTHDYEIILKRGIKREWAEANCQTSSISDASLMLGYEAKSEGIMLESAEYSQWQFKPDTPWESKDGSKPKYRTPLGEYDIFLAKHPEIKAYWRDLEALKARCFTIDGKPYLLITEGGFKAIMGCQHDIPTVALVGVTMGLTPKSKGEPDLVPGLKRLAEAGFGFIIAFDADATTNKNVRIAEAKLTKVLKSYGCPVLSVTGHWKKEGGKGMDDFIQKNGIEAFRAILRKAHPVDSESRDTGDCNKKAKFPSSDAMAREIAEDYRDRLRFNNTNLCWYRYEADSPGIWSPETDEYIESVVYQIVKSKGLTNLPPAYIGATVRFLRHELIERQWKSRADLLPFQNGALEIATGKLLPHSPGYHFTWTLPRAHCAVASDWHKIEAWLDFATQGNQHVKNLLIAFCNAVLKGRADLQKALHLIGIGGSGKGSFCRLVIALIGIENTHSSSLDDWSGNRFEVAQAYEKRLLLFPDEDKGARQLSKFKQVTGVTGSGRKKKARSPSNSSLAVW